MSINPLNLVSVGGRPSLYPRTLSSLEPGRPATLSTTTLASGIHVVRNVLGQGRPRNVDVIPLFVIDWKNFFSPIVLTAILPPVASSIWPSWIADLQTDEKSAYFLGH